MGISTIYILISVLGGAVGQILLKSGMNNIGEITLSLNTIFKVIFRMLTNPYVFVGLFIYVFSVIFWLAALSRVDLSYAYPFASMSYVIMFLASWLLLHENITPMRIIGTLVVGLGVFLISRS
jgi:drug/metabolite transporter (DMT)-like permease